MIVYHNNWTKIIWIGASQKVGENAWTLDNNEIILAGGLTFILGFDVMYLGGAQLVEWSLSVGIEGLPPFPPATGGLYTNMQSAPSTAGLHMIGFYIYKLRPPS